MLTVAFFNLTSFQIFHVKSCIRVGYYKSFGENCCLHFRGRLPENHLPEYMALHYCKILKTELLINMLYSYLQSCIKFAM